MPDPKTQQQQVTLEVTTDAAATGSNPPEEAAARPAWLVALELLINHPVAHRIAVATVAAVVLLVAFLIQYAPQWWVNAKQGKATPVRDVYPIDDEYDDETEVPFAIGIPHDLAGVFDAPAEFIPADKKKPAAPPLPPQSEAGTRTQPSPRAPRPRFAAPAQTTTTPAWLQPIARNLAIPEELSLRHESAVDPNALGTLGWSDLAPDQKQWFRGRAALELEVMVRALTILNQSFAVQTRGPAASRARLILGITIRSLTQTWWSLRERTPPEDIPSAVQSNLRSAHRLIIDMGYTPPDFSEGLTAQ